MWQSVTAGYYKMWGNTSVLMAYIVAKIRQEFNGLWDVSVLFLCCFCGAGLLNIMFGEHYMC